MATTATPWTGYDTDKLYLQSGQFTSTLKDSLSIGTIKEQPNGISWDGTNTPWCADFGTDKLFLQSGQFTSTLKTSQSITWEPQNNAVSIGHSHTHTTGSTNDKLFWISGKFSSTIKASRSVSTIDLGPIGISWDSHDTPWAGYIDNKLYLQSGRFTSTLKTSQDITSIDTVIQGISWDGTNTPWTGSTDDKLYLQSGQFTSTLKTSQSTVTWDSTPSDICTNDFASRVPSLIYERTVTSSISLGDIEARTVIFKRSLADNSVLTQLFIGAGLRYTASVEHDLINDGTSYDEDTGEYTIVHYGLGYSIDYELDRPRTIIQDVIFNQEIEYIHIKASATAKSVTSTLSLSHSFDFIRSLQNTLNLGQSVGVEITRGISNNLSLSHSIGVKQILNPKVIHSLIFDSKINYTYNETDVNVFCNYSPFVGETFDSTAPRPPSTTPPILIFLDEITLTSDYSSIMLRNPELGDRDRLSYDRISRETRGGTLIVYADPTWPRTQQLILEFRGLSETEAQDLLNFIALSLGQYIELMDWESRMWGGIITAPQNPIIRNGECDISVTVEFEGGSLHKPGVITELDTLDQIIRVLTLGRSVTNTLSLGQQVTRSIIVGRSLTSSLSLGHSNWATRNNDDTPWSGGVNGKLFLQSGQFTSTLKDSEDVSAIEAELHDISYDGINTPWTGQTDDKLYLQSGQFTSTLKTSQYVGGTDVKPRGISFDINFNTPWMGGYNDKLYLQSGQFTSTLKTSQVITTIDNVPVGISYDDNDNTPWIGSEADKLYLQSGQFTSTVKTSQDVSGINISVQGISYDGTDSPWSANGTNDKLYLQSGHYTSTLKTSQSTTTWDTSPTGICTNQIVNRIL